MCSWLNLWYACWTFFFQERVVSVKNIHVKNNEDDQNNAREERTTRNETTTLLWNISEDECENHSIPRHSMRLNEHEIELVPTLMWLLTSDLISWVANGFCLILVTCSVYTPGNKIFWPKYFCFWCLLAILGHTCTYHIIEWVMIIILLTKILK